MPRHRLRRRAVAAAVGGVVAVLALAWVAWYAFGQSEPTPWTKPAEVEGHVVHLTYIGSECQDSAAVDVEEDAERVVLTVRATVRATACNDVGVGYEIDARLDAPLGDRELVDGACQVAELATYADCRPGKPTR